MYLIGVDGGGTKTESAVADNKGVVVATGVSGPSNPRDVGVEKAALNIGEAVRKALFSIEKKKIALILAGIPCIEEEYGEKKEVIRRLVLENIRDLFVEEEKFIITSDQEVAFRSGTDEKEGVVVISGTGSVARGWKGEKDVKTSGWGWLTDKGGASQVGQEALRKTVEAVDGRSERSLLTDMVMEKFNTGSISGLNKIIYQGNPVEVLAPLSIVVNEAAEKGDKIAQDILEERSKELAFSAKNTIGKLGFEKSFPLVLVGGVFKSNIFLSCFKKEILSFCSEADIILPQANPVVGAVKLALEEVERRSLSNFSDRPTLS